MDWRANALLCQCLTQSKSGHQLVFIGQSMSGLRRPVNTQLGFLYIVVLLSAHSHCEASRRVSSASCVLIVCTAARPRTVDTHTSASSVEHLMELSSLGWIPVEILIVRTQHTAVMLKMWSMYVSADCWWLDCGKGCVAKGYSVGALNNG